MVCGGGTAMKSKRQDYDSVQSLIIATAARLFTENGADGTSLNDIAKAANLAKGTLYYYYPAKDELIADIARTHGDWLGDTVLAWAETLQRDTDAYEAMKSLMRQLLLDEMHTKLHVVLCAHAAVRGGELNELIESMRKKWALMLEVGSLKLQSNDARTIRLRSGAFFSMAVGYMTKNDISDEDIDEFVGIFLAK